MAHTSDVAIKSQVGSGTTSLRGRQTRSASLPMLPCTGGGGGGGGDQVTRTRQPAMVVCCVAPAPTPRASSLFFLPRGVFFFFARSVTPQ